MHNDNTANGIPIANPNVLLLRLEPDKPPNTVASDEALIAVEVVDAEVLGDETAEALKDETADIVDTADVIADVEVVLDVVLSDASTVRYT